MANAKKSSASARSRSSRLVAVQTLYGVLHTEESMKEAVADILSKADHLEVDGEQLVVPDKILLQKILYGVDERKVDLEGIIEANTKTKKSGDSELLLKSILLCGVYELLAHNQIDAPIIINDYIDVTHSFYDQAQVKLVNAVLDASSKALR